MNPLLNNRSNNITSLIQQFNQFKQQMNGQDPQEVLNNLIKSGRVTEQQVSQATEMAKRFGQFIK